MTARVKISPKGTLVGLVAWFALYCVAEEGKLSATAFASAANEKHQAVESTALEYVMADKKPPPKYPKPKPDKSDGKRPKHRPEGREHQVHQDILDRRWEGGRGKPTPEDYQRALEQWKNLPGSVVRPPTDITETPPEKPGATPKENEEPSKEGG